MIRHKKQKTNAIITILISLTVLCIVNPFVSAQDDTTLEINCSKTQVDKNDQFFSTIFISPSEPIIGVQIDLSFDADLLQCENVQNANKSAWNSYFNPIIDNTEGKITGAGVINYGSTISYSTTCFNITWSSLNKDGTSTLTLQNILVTNETGKEIATITSLDETIVIGNGTNTDDTPLPNDNNGDSGIIPSGSNEAPIIKEHLMGPTSIFVNQQYNFTVTGLDPDDDDIFYLINWGDNTSQSWLGPYQTDVPYVFNHSWDSAGNYTVKVKLKDTNNHETTWVSYLNVTVQQTSSKQSTQQTASLHTDFDITPNQPGVGEQIQFTPRTNNTDENNIAGYQWDFGDGTNSKDLNPVHSYTKSGDYLVTLTILDNNESAMNTVSEKISINEIQTSLKENYDNQGSSPESVPGYELITLLISLFSMIIIFKGRRKNN